MSVLIWVQTVCKGNWNTFDGVSSQIPTLSKNLMVIDPLTPSQGHRFDHRLKIFSVFWSTAHPLKFDMQHDHVQKIKFLTPPKGQGVGTQKIVPVHVPFM